MKQEELEEILKQHKLWLNSKGKKGKRANFEGADLRDFNLERVDLERADLRYSNLWRANLEGANLEVADLRCSNLQSANLEKTNFEKADLKWAYVNNKPTPFVLGNQLILELGYSYEEQKDRGYSWNRIEKWTKLNKFTKELFK